MSKKWEELMSIERMRDKIHRTVCIIDYRNYHERVYCEFGMLKEDFDRNWTDICNKIPTTRITGLTSSHVQLWLQKQGIPFIHYNDWSEARWREFHRIEHGTRVKNTDIYKTIEHNNAGNY